MTHAGVSQPPSVGGRLDYLDSLRGQAALAVVWVHFFSLFGYGYFEAARGTPLRAFFNGTAAVSMSPAATAS